jgi:hypothetical protein
MDYLCFRFFILILLAMAAALPAHAERTCDVSAGYYRIVNLTGTEPIEMRAAPSPDADLLGLLAPGDIIESDGRRDQHGDRAWQQVRLLQTEGWVQARSLWRALPQTQDNTEFPVAGWCGATDPIWSLKWDNNSARIALFPERHTMTLSAVQAGTNPGAVLVSGGATDAEVKVVYSSGVCRNPLGQMRGLGSVQVILSQNGTERLFSGCCSVDPSAFPKRHTPGMPDTD